MTRKLAASALAAALLSAPVAMTAQAATQAHASHATRHHIAKPAAHHTTRSTARTAPSAGNSADALNAQSLTRARGQQ